MTVVVQLLSRVRLFVTPWTVAHQASLSFAISWSLLKLMSIESVIRSNHLILCHPLLLLSSIFPSIRVFSNESVLRIRWPNYWSFSFSISPSNEYSGLISFRMDWLDLLAMQGTLKSLLQHHSSKASILQRSTFFMVHLPRPSKNGYNGNYSVTPVSTHAAGGCSVSRYSPISQLQQLSLWISLEFGISLFICNCIDYDCPGAPLGFSQVAASRGYCSSAWRWLLVSEQGSSARRLQ